MARGTGTTAPTSAGRLRLDLAMVERGLVPSRQKAQALVLAGEVRLKGRRAERPDQMVGPQDELSVTAAPRFVGRGGEKLAGALEAFAVTVTGRVCLDAGASTGGFTDVLLKAGARMVYAVDVGYGQLDWSLRTDERVVVMDRTNVRHLTELPGPAPGLVVADLSFISLRAVLPALTRLALPGADLLLLFKPQFEVGRGAVGKGGVVRDVEVREAALAEFVAWAESEGLSCLG
ncbi:MAG: rRNA (cytidine1920-2-O)/16S rRNA (cytidine1409-2-O)-methyltransferase, partial [Chloroflexota bacterium]|nr:rRNA (cytidine1920-2-O)/16S rRNA (cytidine1409-2-O)-methyltransferase [Chloroflexota bacterium]